MRLGQRSPRTWTGCYLNVPIRIRFARRMGEVERRRQIKGLALRPAWRHPGVVGEARCLRCDGRIAWTSSFVACIDAEGSEPLCPAPLCKTCGREMRPNETVRPPSGRSMWRKTCECATAPPSSYPASAADIDRIRPLLAERGLPSSEDLALSVLASLAQVRTYVEFEYQGSEPVRITADEATAALGHDF